MCANISANKGGGGGGGGGFSVNVLSSVVFVCVHAGGVGACVDVEFFKIFALLYVTAAASALCRICCVY